MTKVGLAAGVIAGCIVAVVLIACGRKEPEAKAPAPELARALPAMAWDHRPEAQKWTKVSLNALANHAAVLTEIVPADIDTYCPAYPQANLEDRQAFWAGLLSALAKHESTWNPDAVGGDGRWFGLVQISPGTAKGYGCQAQSGEALKNGEKNLSCALRIAAVTIPRDGVISRGGRGFAADWGPFHSERKRTDIINWTRSQSYCSK